MDRHPGRSVLTEARDRRVMRLALMYATSVPKQRTEPDQYALPILHSAEARSGLERGMQPEIQLEGKMKLLRKNVLMAVGVPIDFGQPRRSCHRCLVLPHAMPA